GAIAADAIDQHAGERRAGHVGDGEGRENQAVLRIGKMEFGADQRRQRGQRLPVQVIDGGREHKYRQHQPAEARGVGGRRHWNSMVATSPAVPKRALGLGKYSMATRRGFCAPQPSASSPRPMMATLCGSVTSSFTVLWPSPSMTSRACEPRQSTCLRVPASLPEGLGPSHQGTALSLGLGVPSLYLFSMACNSARAWVFSLSIARASSSARLFLSASS